MAADPLASSSEKIWNWSIRKIVSKGLRNTSERAHEVTLAALPVPFADSSTLALRFRGRGVASRSAPGSFSSSMSVIMTESLRERVRDAGVEVAFALVRRAARGRRLLRVEVEASRGGGSSAV